MARFNAGDLALRKDCALALEAAGAASDAIVFADDLSPDVVATRSGAALALTDHNRLDWPVLGENVVSVVDHHRDERAHLDAADREVDDAAGSASSLVAERMFEAGEPDADVAALLLAALAVDCRGFDPAERGKKFSPRDVAAAHALLDAMGSRVDADRSEDALRSRTLPRAFDGATTLPAMAKVLFAARHDTSGPEGPRGISSPRVAAAAWPRAGESVYGPRRRRGR